MPKFFETMVFFPAGADDPFEEEVIHQRNSTTLAEAKAAHAEAVAIATARIGR